MKKNESEIINLLEKYDYSQFDSLSSTERLYVADLGFSGADYERFRLISQLSGEMMKSDDLKPNKNILAELHGNKSLNAKPTIIRRLLDIKVPAYSAAAALIIAIASSFFLIQPKTVEKIIYKEKAIVSEKIIYKDKPEVVIKYVYVNRKPKAETKSEPNLYVPIDNVKVRFAEKQRTNDYVGIENLKLLSIQKKGKNMTEDSIIRNFMFTIN